MFRNPAGQLSAVPGEIYETVTNLRQLNQASHDYWPVPVDNGRIIVFQSERPGTTDGHGLWMSFNRNYRNRTGTPDYSIPVSFSLPFEGAPTDSMRIEAAGAHSLNGRFMINSDGFEGTPHFVFRNGKPVEMYVTSHRMVDASGKLTRDGFQGLNIYYARFRNNRWSELRHINEINSHFEDRMPYVTQDGTTMYFVSDRPGSYGGQDIYISTRDLKTGKWSEPVNMGPVVNSRYEETAPILSPKEGSLFFSSNRPGGIGHYDIYVSRHDGLSFSRPQNLGRPFNSERDDESFRMTDDQLWAYFASDRRHPDALGEFDLYRIRTPSWLIDAVEITLAGKVLDASSKRPLGIDATIHIHFETETLVINSKRTVRSDGVTIQNNFSANLYSGRKYRMVVSAPGYEPQEVLIDYTGAIPDNRIDERDIYLEPVKDESTDPEEGFRLIPGRVVDSDTNLPLSGTTVRKLAADATQPGSPLAVNREGRFYVPVEKAENFQIQAESPGYTSYEQSYNEEDTEEIIIRMKPDGSDPCDTLRPECIDNTRIFFALNSSAISEKEQAKITSMAEVMKRYPALRIEVQGHTDFTYRGPRDRAFEYNRKLSEERAGKVQRMLIDKGIAEDRLIIRGYSYSRPLTPARDAVKGAKNRRVEFRRILVDNSN